MPTAKFPDCHPLVVDDDRDFTRLLSRCLEKVGVPQSQIRSSVDGDQAVTLLSQDGGIPSFILLDLEMPGRSGLEVLEWIRSAPPPISGVLVFMLTSNSDPKHVFRAFKLRVDSYFIKPMGIDALEGMLKGVVAYWKSRHRPAFIRGSIEPPGGIREPLSNKLPRIAQLPGSADGGFENHPT